MSGLSLGLHDLSVATTRYRLDLTTLAEQQGIDPNKYLVGIGQESMSIAARDEDIVTLAAAAAKPIVERHGTTGIRTLLLATETGIDQSKAAGVYVHTLLGLDAATRVVELKQACYSATAALQFALGIVARDPEQRVLVIAADVAKYDLDSSGESTQGAGAVAMLIAAEPALVEIESGSGLYTEDVMDFWRPNYRSTALVDGKASILAYLRAVEGAWSDYRAGGGHDFSEIATVCYHQPFTKMAVKAHRHLSGLNGVKLDPATAERQLTPTFGYNRVIGNSYTASLYFALAALLDEGDDLTGQRIGFLSYGSGSVSEFFTGVVRPGYREALRPGVVREAIAARLPLEYPDYRERHEAALPEDGSELLLPEETAGPFRLAGIRGHQRLYEGR